MLTFKINDNQPKVCPPLWWIMPEWRQKSNYLEVANRKKSNVCKSKSFQSIDPKTHSQAADSTAKLTAQCFPALPWRFGHTSWATVASQCCPCARGRSRAGTREAWAVWPAGWWDWGRRPAGGPSVGAPCWPWSEPPEWDTRTLRHVAAATG